MAIALMGQRSVQMNGDQYLFWLVSRETVDTGENSPVRQVIAVLRPALVAWGNKYLAGITPSGSFAKGQKRLDFPSFHLELTVIDALRYSQLATLSDRVRRILEYLRDSFVNARVQDPANTNNIISADLTIVERMAVRNAAAGALNGTWSEFVS